MRPLTQTGLSKLSYEILFSRRRDQSGTVPQHCFGYIFAVTKVLIVICCELKYGKVSSENFRVHNQTFLCFVSSSLLLSWVTMEGGLFPGS